MSGFVYFVKPIGLAGPIKIGFSGNPDRRMSDLSAWSPVELELIGYVPGTHKDEFFLHHCFADLHSHREWFRASEILTATVDRIITAGTVDAVRAELKPTGSINGRSGAQASTAQKAWRQLKMQRMAS